MHEASKCGRKLKRKISFTERRFPYYEKLKVIQLPPVIVVVDFEAIPRPFFLVYLSASAHSHFPSPTPPSAIGS